MEHLAMWSVLANLVILAMNIKLYTEYFKDMSARGRKG